MSTRWRYVHESGKRNPKGRRRQGLNICRYHFTCFLPCRALTRQQPEEHLEEGGKGLEMMQRLFWSHFPANIVFLFLLCSARYCTVLYRTVASELLSPSLAAGNNIKLVSYGVLTVPAMRNSYSVMHRHPVGAFSQGWIADKISRKYSIVVAVCIFVVGSAFQTSSTRYSMLVVARRCSSDRRPRHRYAQAWLHPSMSPKYRPPEIRGSLLVIEEFSIVSGIVIAYWITYGTRYIPSEWAWRLPFLTQMLPSFILGAGILFFPFSPRWLASKGRDDEALVALARFRRLPSTDPRVQHEWCDIRIEVMLQRELVEEKHPKLMDGSYTSAFKLELAQWADCLKPGLLAPDNDRRAHHVFSSNSSGSTHSSTTRPRCSRPWARITTCSSSWPVCSTSAN